MHYHHGRHRVGGVSSASDVKQVRQEGKDDSPSCTNGKKEAQGINKGQAKDFQYKDTFHEFDLCLQEKNDRCDDDEQDYTQFGDAHDY